MIRYTKKLYKTYTTSEALLGGVSTTNAEQREI